MEHIEWSSTYEIGIPVIDKQHKRIVDYINELNEADSDNKTLITKIIANLIDYTYSHFGFEEAMMAEAGYAKLAEHQKTHNIFIDKIYAFKQQHEAGHDVHHELSKLLKIWLINHIQEDDMSYASLIKHQMAKSEQELQTSWIKQKISQFFS